MRKGFSFSLVFLLISQLLSAQSFFTGSEVWHEGEDQGIVRYFVYGLAVARDSTILAFAEGRLKPGDAAPHDIVLKRSKDMGRTWQPTQVLIKSRNNECYANPTPIVDKKTGNIFLFYARNYANERSDVYFITSKDNGLTWSKPEKVTSLFNSDPLKRPFHLPGPGHGIALANGRLLMQIWHRFSVDLSIDQRKYGVSVIYSDDHGKTWAAGGYVPQSDSFSANESRLVELSNGKVMLNSRSTTTKKRIKRIISFSRNGGLAWSNPVFGSLPPFTQVDAGLNKLTLSGKTYLLFTRPLGPGRNNLAISLSEDNGKTWAYTKLICKGPATYSDVVVLPDKTILVLFGKGRSKNVTAVRLNIEWIKE